MSGRRALALLLAVAHGGCYFGTDIQTPDPDAISIAIVLYAGEDRAWMVVASPHRPVSDPLPEVTATLVGPDWRAVLTATANSTDECRGAGTNWANVPIACLYATLPEPIREGETYELEGEGPKGSFAGHTVIPTAPLVMEPGDTVRVRRSTGSSGWFQIPIRYRAPPEVGRLWPEILATFGDDAGAEPQQIALWPVVLDVDGDADTVSIRWPADESRIVSGSLHLLGTGWNYANFIRWSQSYGISGEGVYGYFDGAAKSRSIRIIVDDE